MIKGEVSHGAVSSQDKNRYPVDKLLFRRQFILGPRFVKGFKSWQRVKVNGEVFLTVHPDLQVLQIKHEARTLTLLGFMLDPISLQASDTDILSNFIRRDGDFDSIVKGTENLGGRWILIFDDGKETKLFNDATGLRLVCYTDSSYPELWCASQPGLIAQELNLEMDSDAIGFVNSPSFVNNKEHWWPGDVTPFREIKRLIPNHYLDLKERVCCRFWPNSELKRITLEEGVQQCSKLLKGIIESAANRFNLAFAVTAGWDTRVLMAASREVSNRIQHYTLMYYRVTEDSPDYIIPSELARRLGLKHTIKECSSQVDDEFKEIYKRNVVTPHDAWANISEAVYKYLSPDLVHMKGVISSEIPRYLTQCSVRNITGDWALVNKKKVDGSTIARIAGMKDNTFAIKHFQNWITGAKEIAERYNHNIIELFGWEQMTGSWQAMGQVESDIAHEVFTPYNCRSLLTTMLSVELKYRKPPRNELYRRIILNLWPEAFQIKINPIPMLNAICIRLFLPVKPLVYNMYMLARSILRRREA